MHRPVQIPVPPTANHLWKIFGNRQHRTKNYRDWLKHTAELLQEKMGPIEGTVRISITVRFGKGLMRSRDLDNCIKPVIDALKPTKYNRANEVVSEGAGVIPDDSIEIVRSIAIDVEPAWDKTSEAECWVLVEQIDCPALVPASVPRPRTKKIQPGGLL